MSTPTHIREAVQSVLAYYAGRPNETIGQDRWATAVIEEGLRTRTTELGINIGAYRVFKAVNDAIAQLYPMPDEALNRLVELLTCLANTALGMPEPPIPFVASHKRRLYERIGMRDSLLGFVARYLEMEGGRDDAYITTRQAQWVEGHAWKVLEQLSRVGVLAFDDLHARISGRGVPPDVHAVVGRMLEDDEKD